MTLSLLTFFISSCQSIDSYTYPKDDKVSNESGIPASNLTFYFPKTTDSTFSKKEQVDKFVQNWYSSALHAFKEPLLYNYYLNKEVYRFLWLRSFHEPVVISLTKQNGHVLLTTKKLNKQPEFEDRRAWISRDPNLAYLVAKYNSGQMGDSLLLIRADRTADIVFNQTKQITLKEWVTFKDLLSKCHYWRLPSVIPSYATDGAQWILEAHKRKQYRFVDRQSGRELREAGEYLIQLSGLKEEIY